MATKRDLDNLLQWLMNEQQLPGIALSVYQGAEKLYEGSFGYQDMARTIPMTPDTMFRTHSMTKPVTALAGLILLERGVFILDDPVSNFLPEFKNLKLSVQQPDGSWTVEESKEPMLMRHLFNMNVGFFDFSGSPTQFALDKMHDDLGGSKFLSKYSLLTEIRALADVPMLFEPGSRWQYGYGLDILGGVIEAVSGMGLGDFMKENIFDPLEMHDTGHFYKPGWQERMMDCVEHLPDGSVRFCEIFFGDPIDEMHRADGKYQCGSCGLISTLRDYQKLCCMLANGGTWQGGHVIGRKTIDLMRSNLLLEQHIKDFEAQEFMRGYGYGCGVRTLVDPAKAMCSCSVGEFGWVGAAGSWMLVDPAENLSAVFVIQDLNADARYYHDRIRNAVNGLLR